MAGCERGCDKRGYTRYIAWGGAIPSNNDWYLYDATFMVVSSGIYVHYNSGAGMGSTS